MTTKIGYVVGSLSTRSINRRLAEVLIELLDQEIAFVEIPIGDLPLYNHDQDAAFPPEATRLKEAFAASDGLLFVTPEYNRSVPGALKNALDWASRPYGDNSLAGIPAGVIGASIGAPGTSMSQQHLRNILVFLDVRTMPQPEAFIHYTLERFHENGTIIDADTRDFLTEWMSAFTSWVRRVKED